MAEFFNPVLVQKARENTINLAMVCTINALIDAVNMKNSRLPRYLIVVIDRDILNDIDLTDVDALRMIPILINWFVKQINTVIRRKRVDLLETKPGAACSTSIIFVRMLRRIGRFSEKIATVNNLQPKFNDALNHAAAKSGNRILTIASCHLYEHYDHKGGLSALGKTCFFEELDDLFCHFNLDKIKLLPNPKNKPGGKKRRPTHPSHTASSFDTDLSRYQGSEWQGFQSGYYLQRQHNYQHQHERQFFPY